MVTVGNYLWRLIPANPLLLRIIKTGGQRRRDLLIRCIYLGLLIGAVILGLVASVSSYNTANLTDLASISGKIFRSISYLQLGLVALLAPIFTASAISQEQDRQTYDILLSTPLTNSQIVLGSLFSRLFFVLSLLVSGIPVFAITQVFGGVAIKSIFWSFLIAATTALAAGALAIAIATFKTNARHTIFGFYLLIVLYLIGLPLLDGMPSLRPLVQNQPAQTSVFTALHPFLALNVIFHTTGYQPPNLGDLSPQWQSWPWGFAICRPSEFYVLFMLSLSAILITPSILLLRRAAQINWSPLHGLRKLLRLPDSTSSRKPQTVWINPIAWRQARTKTSSLAGKLALYGFILAGFIAAITILMLHTSTIDVPRYITATAYNPANQQLTVHTPNGLVHYSFDPQRTIVTYENHAAPLDSLLQPSEVRNITASGQNILTSIDLGPVVRRLSANQARSLLLAAILIEFAAVILIVTNAAASTVTRQREDGSLELLLSTPITSRYYIWGKLRGLVAHVAPLIALPVISVLPFIAHDSFVRSVTPANQRQPWIILPEALLLLPLMVIVVCAMAGILGMWVSLRQRKTVGAVMGSVGIIASIFAALGWIGYLLLTNSAAPLAMFISAFSPFTLITVLIDPYQYAGRMFNPLGWSGGGQQNQARLFLFFGTLTALGIYSTIVWVMYKSMVKNFDLMIRRQT